MNDLIKWSVSDFVDKLLNTKIIDDVIDYVQFDITQEEFENELNNRKLNFNVTKKPDESDKVDGLTHHLFIYDIDNVPYKVWVDETGFVRDACLFSTFQRNLIRNDVNQSINPPIRTLKEWAERDGYGLDDIAEFAHFADMSWNNNLDMDEYVSIRDDYLQWSGRDKLPIKESIKSSISAASLKEKLDGMFWSNAEDFEEELNEAGWDVDDINREYATISNESGSQYEVKFVDTGDNGSLSIESFELVYQDEDDDDDEIESSRKSEASAWVKNAIKKDRLFDNISKLCSDLKAYPEDKLPPNGLYCKLISCKMELDGSSKIEAEKMCSSFTILNWVDHLDDLLKNF